MVKNKEKRRGRPRSKKVEKDILEATVTLLFDKGLRKMTVDGIAEKAGVSKATIYKWWPNKSVLAVDAFLYKMESELKIPDTGSIYDDFSNYLKSVYQFYKSPIGKVFTQLITETQFHPDVKIIFRDHFLMSRRKAVQEMIQRGIARNEIRQDVDSDIILDLIFGPIIYRLLTGYAPLEEESAQTVVNIVIRGISV